MQFFLTSVVVSDSASGGLVRPLSRMPENPSRRCDDFVPKASILVHSAAVDERVP
jgi:hypothetical protein